MLILIDFINPGSFGIFITASLVINCLKKIKQHLSSIYACTMNTETCDTWHKRLNNSKQRISNKKERLNFNYSPMNHETYSY